MKKIHNSYLILDTVSNPNFKSRIKNLLMYLKVFGYKARCYTNKVPSIEKKYKVSICAIFKNEAPYLREWIEFHKIVGVEHFYLYNNNSEDNYLSIIKPYIDSGLVTLQQWPKNQAQLECYYDCIKNYKSETQWLGFIDIDEYVVPIDNNNIYDFLKKFDKSAGAVKIYWKMFGTSGLVDRDLKSLVVETFTISWPKYYSVGKCFYNTRFDFDYDDKYNIAFHHMFWASWHNKRIPPVNVFNNICMNGKDRVRKGVHPIQINHYFTKSYQEYALKKAKGDVYFKINPHDEEYFYLHEFENTSCDFAIYKYLIKLKLALEIDS